MGLDLYKAHRYASELIEQWFGKGDKPGHPFYGNQHTTAAAGGDGHVDEKGHHRDPDTHDTKNKGPAIVGRSRDSQHHLQDSGPNTWLHDAQTGRRAMRLHRYAVWGRKPEGHSEIVETGDDLKALKEKYDIEDYDKPAYIRGAGK